MLYILLLLSLVAGLQTSTLNPRLQSASCEPAYSSTRTTTTTTTTTTMEDALLSFFNRDLRAPDLSVTALPDALERAREILPSTLPAEGIGEKGVSGSSSRLCR